MVTKQIYRSCMNYFVFEKCIISNYLICENNAPIMIIIYKLLNIFS